MERPARMLRLRPPVPAWILRSRHRVCDALFRTPFRLLSVVSWHSLPLGIPASTGGQADEAYLFTPAGFSRPGQAALKPPRGVRPFEADRSRRAPPASRRSAASTWSGRTATSTTPSKTTSRGSLSRDSGRENRPTRRWATGSARRRSATWADSFIRGARTRSTFRRDRCASRSGRDSNIARRS